MEECRRFPNDFSPILKHTGVKPSLVPRLYPRTQTNCNVKRDGVWQVWQPDGICQTPRLTDAASGRGPSADAVYQMAVWQRAVWQTRRLADGRLARGVWQTPSSRRCLAEGHLADGVW